MPEGQVLEFTHVTKRFNEVTAVSDFSARVEPGAVTAFLGPNGAGKTTTLRILLGQVRATSGTATIGGTAFAELRQPLRTIGSVLEETVYRPRRTAERQLTIAAKANGIPLARVGEVLSLVGLDGEGDSRIGGFSLGMRQRLSVAHALLGDPGALVFDEPANGLDPEGIRWMRLLMRRLADEGRTVLVSSHVLSEVEQVADNVLVLSKGQLVLASGIETLADPKGGSVIVDAADRGALTAALSAAGFDIEVLRSGLTVRGGDAETVGAVAADAGIALSTLVQRGPTLEDVFIDLMRGGRRSARTDAAPPQLAAPVTVPVAEDVATEDVATEDVAAPAAPVESVVAIPVAAAAAWAAEAAAAPADEDVADDLAASVTAAETPADETPTVDAPADEAPADETPAEEAPADEAPAEETSEEEAPAGETSEEEAPAEDAQPQENADAADADAPEADDAGQDEDEVQDDAPGEEPAAPSFDEILFGAAAPVAAESTFPAEPRHSVAEIFESTDDADGDTEDAVADDTHSDDTHADTDDATPDDTASDDTASDDTASEDEEHVGVEVFADLAEGTATEEDGSDADADGTDTDDTDDTDTDADPRSAAVSSMLAAAARAYYEDEPKDYPLSTEAEASDAETPDAASSEESAHWSIASTGVIDTVPVAASDDSENSESSDSESSDSENSENTEHHQDDEHHQDGENHHG